MSRSIDQQLKASADTLRKVAKLIETEQAQLLARIAELEAEVVRLRTLADETLVDCKVSEDMGCSCGRDACLQCRAAAAVKRWNAQKGRKS